MAKKFSKQKIYRFKTTDLFKGYFYYLSRQTFPNTYQKSIGYKAGESILRSLVPKVTGNAQ